MNTLNISTNSEESKPLTVEQLDMFCTSLQRDFLVNSLIHHIEENGCIDLLKELFESKVDKDQPKLSSITELYGIPVYTRSYIPLGEIWMCDEHNRPLKIIKLINK